MKDYSLNFDDSKKFILSYYIEDGKIVAKLASGEFYTIPYSEKNEAIIISKMEQQARYAKTKPIMALDRILAIMQPSVLPLAIVNFIHHGGWYYGILVAIIAGGAIYYPAKVIMNIIRKREIEKLNYFLDHKKELNENIEKSENMKLSVSKKAIKEIEFQKSENKEPININNIDNYSLNDLKTLKSNIERISAFGFIEEEPVIENITEEKGPVLIKTFDNKRK